MLKKSFPLILVLIVILCFSEVFAEVTNVKEVTLYSGTDYSGNPVILTPGNYILSQLSYLKKTSEIRNGKILSMKIPIGYTVTIYSNDDFTGKWLKLKSDVNNLSEKFKYSISSIRIWNGITLNFQSSSPRTFFNDEVETVLPHIILFRDKNLTGPHIHIFGCESNLS
jgi:hypothetical protein